MTETVLCQCSPDCSVEHGTCHCGCGRPTNLAQQTSAERGWIKGEPLRYLRGHASGERKDLHVLTNLDWDNREADCSRCGRVHFKKNGTGIKCTGKLSTTHLLSQFDEESVTAWCRVCKDRVDVYINPNGVRYCTRIRTERGAERRAKVPLEERNAQHKAWRDANRDHLRNVHLLNKYGISLIDRDAMQAAQEGVCAICHRPPRGTDRGEVLHVDHDHITGKVRGLLCHACNVALGGFEDDIDRLLAAVEYLRKHRDVTSLASTE